MRIVVLDDETAGQDVDWSRLHSLGEVISYPSTADENILERARGAEAILTNKVPLTRETLSKLPDLRYIGVTATGYDKIDLVTAGEKGITVTNAPGYGTEAVAQHVFAMLLSLTNRVETHNQDIQNGGWQREANWTYWLTPLIELGGMKLGIMGMGSIGQAVARIGKAFGMIILAYSRTPKVIKGVTWCDSAKELFAQSDVISLHCPLNEQTHHLVDAELLAQLQPHAFLINTSRGGLIDEGALHNALAEKRLSGAALDVLSAEPPPSNHPLLGLDNCLITPHLAWASRASRQRLVDMVTDNLAAFQAGNPQNTVSV